MHTDSDKQPDREAERGVRDQPQGEPAETETADAAGDAPSDEQGAEQVQADETAQAESEQVSPEEDKSAPELEAEAAAMEIDVYGVLRLFVSMVTEQAWIHLGLQTAPGKSETEVRLPEARIAIDTVRFLRKQLEENLEDVEKRELDRTISTLQINYIQRT